MEPNLAVVMLNEHLGGFLGIVPIALHDCWAVDAKLAVLALTFLGGAGFNRHYLNIIGRHADAALRSFTTGIRKRTNRYTFR